MQTFLLIVTVIELLIIAGLVILFIRNNQVYKKVDGTSRELVHGRLNVDDIKVKEGKNTSSSIANSVNAIKSNLMTFVEATKGNVIVLSDAIKVLSKGIDANQVGNEQIANGVTVVADKTLEQFELVKDNLEIIESNSVEMTEVENAVQSIQTLLDDTVTNCQNGITLLEGYESDMNDMSNELKNIDQILNRFNDDIAKIEEIADFIIGVSDHLKLLALNASIEAARAGQAGKGFAVVADEMSVMSSKTKDGIDTINQIVREVMGSSEQVNESIRACESTFHKSVETFEQVNDSFRSIDKQSNDIHNKMAEVSKKFIVMTNNTAETKNKATMLYDTARVINESTSEIAAVSEEVAAESNEIASHTEKLENMLTSIQGLLSQYHTAVVPSASKKSKPVKIMLLSMYDNEFWFGVGRGANYAAKELAFVGGEAEFVPILSDGEKTTQEQVVGAIRRAIEQKYDGLIFPGWMDTYGYALKAIENGIKVMAYNCDCPPEIARVACLCPDSAEPGRIAAKSIVKDLGKTGQVAIVHGDLEVGTNAERYNSFKEEIKKYSGIKIVEEIYITESDSDAYNRTMECLQNNSDIQALFLTNGFGCAASRAIVDSKKAGKVQLYTFDTDPELISYIKKGIIACTIGQDSFGQGHDPIVWLYNHIAADEPFPSDIIHCRVSVIDRNNVDSLIF